jgi:hypothetical protein
VIDIDDVIKEVSARTNVNRDVVDKVCKHVFAFTTDIMKDGNDTHEILFNRLFKFKLKSRFKDNKNKKYSPKA